MTDQHYWSNRFHTNPEYSREHLVFVYGSLKKGFGNDRLLADSEFLMNSITRPIFEMISFGAFPAIIPDSQFHISGEVYRIPGSVLWSIDVLEGEGDFYNRKLISIQDIDKPVWSYILPRDRMFDTQFLCPNLLTNTSTKTQSWIEISD
jgi:gamma-glutamylcyclotransferase (GGCT)/AIG2-like uncharacterized protein YtfP